MAIWRKGKKPPATGSSEAKDEPESPLVEPPSSEKLLDALAELVRIYGGGGFDLDEVEAEELRANCETWAQHLLVGVPPPGREPMDATDEGSLRASGPTPADVPGLRLFLSGHRQNEQDYVVSSFKNLRDAVWAFIHGLRRQVSGDDQDNGKITHRMRRLESAVHNDSAEVIKQEALETIQAVNRIMQDRDERQRAQLEQLAERLDKMRRELDAAREKAAVDPLTDVFNRAALGEHLARVYDFSILFGKTAYAIMIDVDHFKWVNDNHGHPAGDDVLRAIGRVLKRSFQRKEDFVARYGGEEFCVIIREGDPKTIGMLCERAQNALRDIEVEAGGEPIRITTSMGVAALKKGEDADRWIARADAALYRAKDEGRDRVVIESQERA